MHVGAHVHVRTYARVYGRNTTNITDILQMIIIFNYTKSHNINDYKEFILQEYYKNSHFYAKLKNHEKIYP